MRFLDDQEHFGFFGKNRWFDKGNGIEKNGLFAIEGRQKQEGFKKNIH